VLAPACERAHASALLLSHGAHAAAHIRACALRHDHTHTHTHAHTLCRRESSSNGSWRAQNGASTTGAEAAGPLLQVLATALGQCRATLERLQVRLVA
jgi:hypothetical protein